MIDVYYMTVDALSSPQKESMLSALSEAERDHCRKMKKERDFLLSLCGHYMMQSVTGKKDVLYSKVGKPYYKDGPFVSLSHDENTVVLAVCDRPVGVDILYATEARKAKIAQVVGRFVHDIYKGLSLPTDAVCVRRMEFSGVDSQTVLTPTLPISDDAEEYVCARAFTKAEALMKCDGGGFAAITLLCQLKQTMQTLSLSLPELPQSVVTVARLLPSDAKAEP